MLHVQKKQTLPAFKRCRRLLCIIEFIYQLVYEKTETSCLHASNREMSIIPSVACQYATHILLLYFTY